MQVLHDFYQSILEVYSRYISKFYLFFHHIYSELYSDYIRLHQVRNTLKYVSYKDKKEFAEIAKILESINYITSDKSKTEEYQFFASTKEETKSGDIHIHLALKDTNRYKEFILLKEYLLENEKEAIAYSNFKQKLISTQTNNRAEYKRLKSEYVTKIIEKINKANSQG